MSDVNRYVPEWHLEIAPTELTEDEQAEIEKNNAAGFWDADLISHYITAPNSTNLTDRLKDAVEYLIERVKDEKRSFTLTLAPYKSNKDKE